MEFNENKFEMMSQGNNDVNKPGNYKTKSGKEIKPSRTMKDLGVLIVMLGNTDKFEGFWCILICLNCCRGTNEGLLDSF